MELGNNIKELRKQKGLRQEQLAELNNYIIVNEWDFSQAADYMMLTKKERQHCINILDLMVAGDKEAVKTYFS